VAFDFCLLIVLQPLTPKWVGCGICGVRICQ
jgi:hypothetical protein